MKEVDFMHLVQIEATKKGHRLFRNNVGRFELKDGRWIVTGLAVGSSDLIGITSTGRFYAVECKIGKGALTQEQQAFIDMVNTMGGRGEVARG